MTNSFNPAVWVPHTPERELYDIYQQTIKSRFGFFGVRPYEEAAGDFCLPVLPYDDSGEVGQDILDLIVTPDSFTKFSNSLDEYVDNFKLRGWLEHTGSVVFATNHKQFTDVPITAEALGRIGLGQRGKTLQVISKMIAGMTLDLGSGPFVVVDKLRNISTVGQTIPRIDGQHTKALEGYRESVNSSGLMVLNKALNTPSAIVVESIIGRHDSTSISGKTLYVHEPNRRTIEVLKNPRVMVVVLYMNCETFRPDGSIEPADMTFEIREPIQITDPAENSAQIMEFFKTATKNSAEDRVTHVRIKPWAVQRVEQALRRGLSNDKS